jgi:phosphoribosylamine--glycine ligase
MKVLVIGGGGREHALCWKLRQSPLLTELYCAPGNPGIAQIADLVPIRAEDCAELAEFAAGLGIDLTMVGPEVPLTMGLVEEFQRRGLAVFGPSARAAELEGSKVFAKQFMQRHGIPTAEFEVVHDAREAREAARRFGLPVVVKADGLAGGKGVIIAADEAELEEALTVMFDERRFGAAGERVVVEQCLVGEEVSILALSDGSRVLPLATSKDYKRIGEGDTGPNTGGMGAHSPSKVITAEQARQIIESVIRPTVAGMADENRTFVGVLYAGVMLTADGPRVLEFNARFGDPETQPLMLRLENDLLPVLAAGARGDFGGERLAFKKEAAACIVLASAGYPGTPMRGEPITGIEAARAHPGVEVFHAGTALVDSTLVAHGGRVLNVCASGATLSEALRRAYAASAEISWPSKIFRKDIGRRVLAAR